MPMRAHPAAISSGGEALCYIYLCEVKRTIVPSDLTLVAPVPAPGVGAGLPGLVMAVAGFAAAATRLLICPWLVKSGVPIHTVCARDPAAVQKSVRGLAEGDTTQ
jgi:hypothetical protein